MSDATQPAVDPALPPFPRREAAALFLLALLLRLAATWALDAPRMAASGDPWTWGQETACSAESLLSGGPYGDPWNQDTGASAWLAPAFPAFVAACAALTGGIGRPAAWLLHGSQALVSAATCLLLLALGRRVGAPRAGHLAAWGLALLPASIWNASFVVWDTTWSAAALTGYLVLALGVRPRPLLEGLAFGGLGLISPALHGILPAVLVHLLRRPGEPSPGRRLVLFLVGALVVAGPWMVRNARVVGTANLRSNLGLELRVGNNDQAYGRHETDYHPSHTPAELERYRRLGEREYCRVAGREALEWIGEHPGRFVGLCLTRLRLFWIGESPAGDVRVDERVGRAELVRGWVKWAAHGTVGVLGLLGALLLRRRGTADTLLRWTVVLFPLPYYVTHVAERYRFPIEPLLLLLALTLLTREALTSRSAAPGPGPGRG